MLDLLAFHLDSHPLAVIEKYTPHRPADFFGPLHLPEATIAIVYFGLPQHVPASSRDSERTLIDDHVRRSITPGH
ncbi:hypothetical protein [Rhodococcus qingshengii]|uniref:hypothetical protein n=1 Tax=Rhodococcus qingshengii TaxID=334542 RepID=UPI001BED3235|nr:hypothetical protein [Rhodococcus qingshengii]MBT2273798.1 hypothetical protein [Rhodococcus qingshengii]